MTLALLVAAGLLGAIWLAGLSHEPTAIVAAFVLALPLLCVPGWPAHRSGLDWRIRAILLAMTCAVGLTLLVYAAGLGRDPATFFGAAFAGWVSGVALFALTGVFVAIVSLAKPEDESVEGRARILFRGQKGRHIDYIVAVIRTSFEHYTESVIHTITISEFHPDEEKFRVLSEGETRLRAYIDDAMTTYRSRISMSEVSAPPAGGAPNRLTYLRVGRQNRGGADFRGTSLEVPFDTTIEPGADCLIADGMEYWVTADTEENSYRPIRFTQFARLTVRNYRRDNRPLDLKISDDGGQTFKPFQIQPGEVRTILEARDVEPDKVIYDLRLLA